MRISFLLLLLLLQLTTSGQRGKEGIKVITTSGTIVNEYSSLTTDAIAGSSSITVNNSSLNANNQFPASLTTGDLIFIIQMQGAAINGAPSMSDPNIATPNDSTWGQILNYNNCGNYEFAEVASVPNSTTINLNCPLMYNYTANGIVQIVRVPRYAKLFVQSNFDLTCSAWSGVAGGVLVVEVLDSLIINPNGKIIASSKGFRGGALDGSDNFPHAPDFATTKYADYGAEKGEGIAGYQATYNQFGGRYGKGAAANGGGGGNSHNAGGAGGANGGDPNLWNGYGMPDTSTPAFTTAWNLEYPGLATQISSGGGKGGYTWSNNNLDALLIAPGDSAWSGDFRRSVGGFGGRPLDYSTGKIFLGGGGGAGNQNNGNGGGGGYGGGLIFLQCFGTVTGNGTIVTNGAAGNNSNGNDPAGGAGAGGTIVIHANSVANTLNINANGGVGGTHVNNNNVTLGPGGGGGGGYIRTPNLTNNITVAGGLNGITTTPALTEFPANGATKGANGTIDTSLNFYSILAPDDSVCSGDSTILTATLSGNFPPGIQIVWYDSLVNGNVISIGNNYTTPAISSTSTFFVSFCPGYFRQPVTVYIKNYCTPFIAIASSDTNFCEKQCIDFFDLSTNNPTSWQWNFTGASPSGSTLQNPSGVCYNSNGSFPVTLIACNQYGCDSITLNNFINEFPNPVDSIFQLNDTLYSLPSVYYQWYEVSIGAISGATNQYYVVTQPGNYYCITSDSIGCVATSNNILITAILEHENFSDDFFISPVPASDYFNIRVPVGYLDKLTLEVENILGEKIIELRSLSDRVININANDFASGIYFIKLNCGNKYIVKKIVIQ